jgi:preprotein translocase subunit SecA
MNEQRKVIYALRDQVLDKSDLRDKITQDALPDAVSSVVETHCVSEYNEEWDLDGLHAAVRTYWPSTLTVEQLGASSSTTELYETLMDEALTHYEKRETELTPNILRQVERQVMLRVIDQRWRAHLYEMDYLREGINLRAMGQKDPLVEWQREGFDMFGQMMHGIWQDFIRYVMHVQVQLKGPTPAAAPVDGQPAPAPVDGQPAPAPVDAAPADTAQIVDEEIEDDAGTSVRNISYSSPDDPSVSGGSRLRAAAAAAPVDAPAGAAVGAGGATGNGAGGRAAAPVTNTPVVKSDWDKTPRNAPCPCGSGKKYKLCHGK